MTLYSIPDMKRITRIPHDHENRPIINRIPEHQLGNIVDEINRRVNAVVDTSEEVITGAWIPGSDWSGTVWEPIYIAAGNNFDLAGMVFGALVFEVMINRPEDWSFGKFQVNGRDIKGITYFRIYQ